MAGEARRSPRESGGLTALQRLAVKGLVRALAGYYPAKLGVATSLFSGTAS